MVPCLTALPTASFIDASRSMMTPPKAVSTLAGSSVSEDVAVEFFEPDLDGSFFYVASRIDELSDVLFARHYDLLFSRVPVCSARVRGSCDRGYRGDFDSHVFQELLDVFVGHARGDAEEDCLVRRRPWGIKLCGDGSRLECAPGVLV